MKLGNLMQVSERFSRRMFKVSVDSFRFLFSEDFAFPFCAPNPSVILKCFWLWHFPLKKATTMIMKANTDNMYSCGRVGFICMLFVYEHFSFVKSLNWRGKANNSQACVSFRFCGVQYLRFPASRRRRRKGTQYLGV
jgi:hypothetical protein